MTLLYRVIPLIMYLVSSVQNASLKKTDPRSFFFFRDPLASRGLLDPALRQHVLKERQLETLPYPVMSYG